MNYLFFDIECADGTHMCSFGYVIVDEHFGIKEKNDILINPRCEFKLGKYRKQPYINLSYPAKEFYKSADFVNSYEKIKQILFADNAAIFGHAVASDLEFLDIACDRYKKARFDISVLDTQKIYSAFSDYSEMRSLEKIMSELEIQTDALSAHKSCDDAEMSMITVKEICDRRQIDIKEFVNKYECFVVDRKAMDIAYRKREIRKYINNAKRRYPESKFRKKIFIEKYFDGFSERTICALTKIIYKMGFAVTLDKDKCDYYVTESLDFNKPENKNIKIINYEELSEMLGITIKNGGELIYFENNNSVSSLKIFFDNAQKNNKKIP